MNKIEKVNILGVEIAAINMDYLVEYTKQNINKMKGKYICVANVHTTVTAYENKEYQNIQNNALLVIPDGGPLASEGRKRGHKKMFRTVGQDYMKEMFKLNYRHYFFGSTEETLEKMINSIKKDYPNINIVGSYSPSFGKISNEEDEHIINMINKTNPDFVWVGLGAPKQEEWMYNHQDIIDGLMIGVGAAFDYFAGNIKRAPILMQKLNLEWLFRLLQEPKRLFSRYLMTNTKFIWNAIIKGK